MVKNYFITFLLFIVTPILFGQTVPIDPLDPIFPFQTAAVGKTEGALNVSLTGAAVYEIPIKVPVGSNGVQPEISLQYNSQSGNGIAGLGWGIAGVSSISRIPSTLFHDGKVSAVDFSKNDRFALDGQRLLLKSGIYGGDGAEYQTESYSNLKITSHGVSPYGANYGPKYFKVSYPDGSVAMFGNSNSSRSKLSFGIANFTNASGVKLLYEYIEKGGNILISKIKYVSTLQYVSPEYPDIVVAGALPILEPYLNEVTFHYSLQGKQIKEQGYVGGSVFNNSELLIGIETKSSNTIYREYKFEYQNNPIGYERLVKVKELNGINENSVAPLIFKYEDNKEKIELTTQVEMVTNSNLSGDSTAKTHAIITGDYDGDGDLDYILYNKQKAEYWVFNTSVNNQKTGAYKLENANKSFNTILRVNNINQNNEVLTRDSWITITGNTLKVNKFENNNIIEEFSKNFYFPSVELDQETIDHYGSEICGSTGFTPAKQFFSGDFTGSGKTDVIAIELDEHINVYICDRYGTIDGVIGLQSSRQVYLLNMERNGPANYTILGDLPLESNSRIFVQDFTGDGRADIMVVNTGRILLYSLNLNNQQLELLYNSYENSIISKSQIHVGDFNGDGKTDLLVANENSSAIYYSTGTSFEKKPLNFSCYSNPEGTRVLIEGYNHDVYRRITSFICDDVNNDGKTDIISVTSQVKINPNHFYIGYDGSIESVRVMNSTGIDFKNGPSFYAKHGDMTGFNMFGDNLFQPIPFNLTPEKRFAFTKNNYRLGFFISGGIIEFESYHNNGQDILLKELESDGVVHKIQYGRYGINQNGQDFNHFQKYDNEIGKYPLFEPNFLNNISVVSKITLGSDSKSLSKSFSYASPVFDSHGLGFLGFKGIVSTNWYDKPENMYKNIKEFDINKRGALKKESVILGSNWSGFNSSTGNGLPILKPYKMITTYENGSQLSSNKVFKLQNTKTVFTDYAGESFGGQFIKEVQNTYNTNNDITKQTTFYRFKSALAGYPASTVKTEFIENDYIYGATSSNYFMSRLINTKKTETIPNQESFISEDSFVYDDKGRILEVKKKGNNTGLITEKNTYDHRGNIIEKSITAGNLTPRVTKFKFGYNGRFVTEKTDVTGLKTLYSYDGSKGLLIEETNPFGQKTKYSYDNWGKQVSVIDYLGKKETSSYRRNGNTVEITISNEQGLWEKEFFDSFGNKTKVSSKNLIGEIVNKNYEYDAYNRVIRESENYFGSTPSLWTTTKYDRQGRISKIVNSKGKEITTTYSLSKTTIKDGVTTREEVIDAAGNVVSRKDAGGTINYKYFPNGNLKSTNFDGVETVIEQDGWGRKTKLTDPSAGVYIYQYNALCELIKETTPKGTTQYTLDDFGRITKKTIIGDETNNEINYTFDEATQLLTSSHSLLNGQAYSYNYGYDSHKRLNSTTEITPHATFTKNLSFDEYGRQEQETFKAVAYGKTSEKKVKHTYKNGFHWQVIDAVSNQVLTEKASVNNLGLLTLLNLGNGLQIHNAYNDHGYLIGNAVNRGQVNVFKLTNTFDIQRGNLLSRTNGLFNRHETFEYDDLDRLTSFTNKSGVQESQYYDTKGRIEENNLGTYEYPSNTSYQLGAIELNSEAQSYYHLRPEQRISYNAFKSPVWIKEREKENLYFDYNANNQRSTMYYGNEATDKTQSSFRKHYSADGSMEVTYDVTNNTADFVTYIDGDAYSATVISKGSNTQDYFYLHRDYLGSIIAVTNRIGLIVEKRHFDAWGNLVFVKDLQNNDLEKLTFLDRGYTGHEHLQGVALIHMNGRLYDPVVRRFLAPDNFVQDMTNTQNFNRYGYVLNNPLKYTDESGEFIFTAITAIFDGIKGFVKYGVNFDKYDWHKTTMAWKIDAGMFKGNFGQLLSKWNPWGLVNNVIGNVVSHAFNLAGTVKDVTYLEGAVALEVAKKKNVAFTLGYYINGPRGFKADWKDHLFVHEYGHIIQGNIFGPFYLSTIAIPSLMDSWLEKSRHSTRWYEAQASSIGGKYFNEKYGTGAKGYVPNSEFYFDINSFRNEGVESLYFNPRNGGKNNTSYTSHFRIHWSDVGYFLIGRIL